MTNILFVNNKVVNFINNNLLIMLITFICISQTNALHLLHTKQKEMKTLDLKHANKVFYGRWICLIGFIATTIVAHVGHNILGWF